MPQQQSHRFIAIPVCFLLLSFSALADTARIQVIGDSILAWRDGHLARVLSEVLNEPVADASINGAHISASAAANKRRPDIATQLDPVGRDWIIMTGGGNDLAVECDCLRCEPVLDRLLSSDGTDGEIHQIVTRARNAGARVIYALYYDNPSAGGPFTPCTNALNNLEQRIRRLADATPGMGIADLAVLVDPDDLSNYAIDRIHPARNVTRRMARLFEQIIKVSE